MRELLVNGNDFKWGYPSGQYFSYEQAEPSIKLVTTLVCILLIPILFHSIIKYLKKENVMNMQFYRYYMTLIRILDYRILHTSFSVLDVLFTFVWIFINVAFVDPFDFPRQIGYLIVCNSALIMVPVFRNSIFVVLFSIPFERAIKYHRWLGRGIFILTTIHLAGYWDKWLKAGTFSSQIVVLPNLFAHIAWFALIVLTFTSFGFIRRNWFEVFFYTHFSFLLFFIFGILHFPALLPFALPGLILYGMDRLIRLIRAYPKNTDISIVSDGSLTRITGKRLGILNYECGQYGFINIPEISKFQWHPISFCSAPSDPSFMFYIKTLGGWSKSLSKLNGKKPLVRIDGPYGSTTHDVKNYDVIMLCCGGIGVTPMISIMRDLHYKISVNLLDIKKIYLFWTMRDPSMYYSLGDCFNDLISSSQSSCFNLSIWITQPGQPSPLFIRGRPDWNEIFRTIAEIHHDVDRVAVLSCGPSNLVEATWDCSNRYSNQQTSFDFHQETFEF